jgi:hypothetical protein
MASEIKEALQEPMKKTNFPSFSAIMKYSGTNAADVYHLYSKKYALNAFFGRCTKRKEQCTKDHSPEKAQMWKRYLNLQRNSEKIPLLL